MHTIIYQRKGYEFCLSIRERSRGFRRSLYTRYSSFSLQTFPLHIHRQLSERQDTNSLHKIVQSNRSARMPKLRIVMLAHSPITSKHVEDLPTHWRVEAHGARNVSLFIWRTFDIRAIRPGGPAWPEPTATLMKICKSTHQIKHATYSRAAYMQFGNI